MEDLPEDDDVAQVNHTQKYTTGRHRASDATPDIDKLSNISFELESPSRLMKEGLQAEQPDLKKEVSKRKVSKADQVKEVGRTFKKEDPIEN